MTWTRTRLQISLLMPRGDRTSQTCRIPKALIVEKVLYMFQFGNGSPQARFNCEPLHCEYLSAILFHQGWAPREPRAKTYCEVCAPKSVCRNLQISNGQNEKTPLVSVSRSELFPQETAKNRETVFVSHPPRFVITASRGVPTRSKFFLENIKTGIRW